MRMVQAWFLLDCTLTRNCSQARIWDANCFKSKEQQTYKRPLSKFYALIFERVGTSCSQLHIQYREVTFLRVRETKSLRTPIARSKSKVNLTIHHALSSHSWRFPTHRQQDRERETHVGTSFHYTQNASVQCCLLFISLVSTWFEQWLRNFQDRRSKHDTSLWIDRTSK